MKRRFTKTGEWNGVSIFDDYGHHPVEIAAVLKAARASTEGQVIAVVQPHRYTRLSALFNDFCTCFNDADAVIVAPVYAAGEQPIPGADRDGLVEGLKARGHRNVMALEQVGGPRRAREGDRQARTTTWSASAPATSRNGPMRCPASSSRSARRRRDVPGHHRRPAVRACRTCAGRSRRMLRRRRCRGSAPAVPRRCSSRRPTPTTWPISSRASIPRCRCWSSGSDRTCSCATAASKASSSAWASRSRTSRSNRRIGFVPGPARRT